MKLKLTPTWMACIYLAIIAAFDVLLKVVLRFTPAPDMDLSATMYKNLSMLEDAREIPHSTYIPYIITMLVAVVIITLIHIKGKKFVGNKILSNIVAFFQVRVAVFAILIYADWFIVIKPTSFGQEGALEAFFTVCDRLKYYIPAYLVLSYVVIISIILVSVAKKHLVAPATQKGNGI